MKEKVYRKFVELSNGKWSSKVLKKFSTAKLSKAFIPSYIKVFNIDTTDISNERKEFKSLHQFFIRTLKDHARPIANEPHLFASPVDAKIESFGMIEDNISFVVKGKKFIRQCGASEKLSGWSIYCLLFKSSRLSSFT